MASNQEDEKILWGGSIGHYEIPWNIYHVVSPLYMIRLPQDQSKHIKRELSERKKNL